MRSKNLASALAMSVLVPASAAHAAVADFRLPDAQPQAEPPSDVEGPVAPDVPASRRVRAAPVPNPTADANPPAFVVFGADVRTTATVFVDGQPSPGATLSCSVASAGLCNDGIVTIDLATSPGAGLHLLQLQNPAGLLSNELPVCFGPSSGCLTD